MPEHILECGGGSEQLGWGGARKAAVSFFCLPVSVKFGSSLFKIEIIHCHIIALQTSFQSLYLAVMIREWICCELWSS